MTSTQDVWMAIGGLIVVVIISLKLVTLADVHEMRYLNMVRKSPFLPKLIE